MTCADQHDQLLALARRCESTGRPDRNLDADIYEALGFTVRRKPAHLIGPRTPPGGIYQQGSLWKAIGKISAEIDVAVNVIRQKAPEWNWSLQSVASEEQTYEALVAGCSGHGALASLALCAALLKAFARSDSDQTSAPADR
ncbi:hypothetical protein ASE66_18160 [Bosea sp. Root483D1]|uniref:hypothetical protein n=1 Tax=Bosea sp. Root483D1 TaxID=1736544 RepID=UPI0007095C67|nr:hypothetical protein [Bosea sp. Root483D1]KRE12466.1 hypothetical protein ASE66_18160 [Bosea sp. Root483D1]